MGKWPLLPKVKDKKHREECSGAADIQSPGIGQAILPEEEVEALSLPTLQGREDVAEHSVLPSPPRS